MQLCMDFYVNSSSPCSFCLLGFLVNPFAFGHCLQLPTMTSSNLMTHLQPLFSCEMLFSLSSFPCCFHCNSQIPPQSPCLVLAPYLEHRMLSMFNELLKKKK